MPESGGLDAREKTIMRSGVVQFGDCRPSACGTAEAMPFQSRFKLHHYQDWRLEDTSGL